MAKIKKTKTQRILRFLKENKDFGFTTDQIVQNVTGVKRQDVHVVASRYSDKIKKERILNSKDTQKEKGLYYMYE